jgi:hypothetical protein
MHMRLVDRLLHFITRNAELAELIGQNLGAVSVADRGIGRNALQLLSVKRGRAISKLAETGRRNDDLLRGCCMWARQGGVVHAWAIQCIGGERLARNEDRSHDYGGSDEHVGLLLYLEIQPATK